MVIRFEKGTDVEAIYMDMKKFIYKYGFLSISGLLNYLEKNGIAYETIPPFTSRSQQDWGWTELNNVNAVQSFHYAPVIRIPDPVMRHVERGVDNVNHPEHYISKNGIETIDVIQAFTEDLSGIEATDTGNIIKYISRWKKKNGLEDLKKARWYLDHLIAHVEKEDDYEIDAAIDIH